MFGDSRCTVWESVEIISEYCKHNQIEISNPSKIKKRFQ